MNPGVKIKNRYVSVRWRFIALSALILITVFSGMTFVLVRNSTRSLRENLNNQTIAFASLATKQIGETFIAFKDSGKLLIDRQVRDYIQLNENVRSVTVYDLDGSVAYDFSLDNQKAAAVSSQLASTFDNQYHYEHSVLKHAYVPFFEASRAHRYTIAYSVTAGSIDAAIARDGRTLIIFAVEGLVLTIILTYFLINWSILRSITQLSRQAGKISTGDLEQQISITRHDEIGDLAISVSAMAESLKQDIIRLKELDKVKSEFMSIASHNLRTPLTIIKGYLSNAKKFNSIDEYQAAFGKINEGAQRLARFAEDMLIVSQLELGFGEDEREAVDVAAFVKDIGEEFDAKAQEKNITYIKNIASLTATVSMYKPHIRTALINILDNAFKFTPEYGTVTLTLKQDGSNAVMSVADTGIGIDPVEKDKLFTKFHRGTSVMTYDYDGVGVGLYASSLMVEHQGGTISVDSHINKGSTFTITLPIIAPASPEPAAIAESSHH